MSGPLEGLRVLDLATIVAGPFAATLLADYGAEVLKVELPGAGDGARGFGPFKDGKSLWWKVINRNKDFLSLDLRKPEGAEILKRLLPRFDVLIENFRPGTLDRWGLTKDVLWRIQPRLVILRTTGYGQNGPYRDRPAFARVFEAMAGLTYITGETDGQPMHAGYPIGDAVGGLFGAIGVLAACWKRARDPAADGEEIDLSLTEATLRILEFLPIEFDQLGAVRQRSGNRNQYSAPSAVFRSQDGHWVTLAGSTNAVFANNCRAIGRSDLIDDPRFATNALRCEHAGELNAIFLGWCGNHDLAVILDAFAQAQGTLAPINSIDQIFSDPQMIARDAITSVADDDFGSVRMQNVVPRFVRDRGKLKHSARSLGYDTERILGEWLGMSSAEQDQLRRLKVI
ncbi:CaiB/BaiF CoA transferase family protein [Bradyrhizobium mercantei]|uniref:CaiB/BaiF CoA transferase family protein n=1 Tax=Bradyrhizobium mercantei TaxID=1904807 RepID=UPI000975883F|nr:CaiB/BaiF CoA-transferase family protein [Bradyrhizobium mercantei]